MNDQTYVEKILFSIKILVSGVRGNLSMKGGEYKVLNKILSLLSLCFLSFLCGYFISAAKFDTK